MIYPDVSVEEWIGKYPDLSIKKGYCDYCSKEMLTTTPFIETGYVGLVCHNCTCGKNRHQVMTMLPVGKQKILEWKILHENI